MPGDTLVDALKARCEIREGNLPTLCWIWTGCNSGARPGCLLYGRVRFKGPKVAVHRLMYELHHGPIPEGYVVRHKCDEPLCCNPDHLVLGTQSDNVRDCIKRGRHNNFQAGPVVSGEPQEHAGG